MIFFMMLISLQGLYSETKILSQTQSSVYCLGENINLTIDADGNNLKYQWFRDGIILNHENKNILNLYNLKYENSATYQCEIIGELDSNSIKSDPIAVYVASPTEITEQPLHSGWEFGKRVKFTVGAHINGNGEEKDVKFQWYKGKERFKDTISNYQFFKNKWRIVGSQSPILEITFLMPQDQSDSIYCVVTGRCGSAKTNYVKLKENAFFKYKVLTPYINKCVGDSAVLKVEVTQTEPGTLIYQWYRTGNRKVYDDDRISGSNTKTLTIRNTNLEDNGTYYLRITHLESGYFLNTYTISLFIETDPNINPLRPEYTVYNRKNGTELYGVLRINVSSLFVENYYFEWYCNNVLTYKGKGINGYMVLIPNPGLKYEGKWYCKVIGNCGVVFTDTCYVRLGYKDIYSCMGTDTVLSVRKHPNDTGQMRYNWYFNGSLIHNDKKFQGSTTIDLSIKSMILNDEGRYHCYAYNEITKETSYIGFVYLDVMDAPKIRKILFDTLVVFKNMAMEVYMTILTESETYIELYKDSVFYKTLYFNPANWEDTFYTISMCATGKDSNLRGTIAVLPSGKYKFHIVNQCGDIWGREFVIINRDEKKGIVNISKDDKNNFSDINSNLEDKSVSTFPENEDISEELQTFPETGINDNYNDESIFIYPNPATDYICLKPSDGSDIQIFDMLGVNVINVGTRHALSLRIDISNLPSGMYFIKIGNRIEMFVKM
jgi:hypothetical protein